MNIFDEIFGYPFEIIESGFASGRENMDFDMNRTNAVAEGSAPSMFRLYGWKPWCVSLGANQKESDIDKEACRKFGFDIVRRPTGGRAVLHAEELTYSVVTTLPKGMAIHDAYREIHIILLNGISKLGNNLEFEKSQPDFRELYKQGGSSLSCFASSARYEIAYQGRKAVGSAQRIIRGILLQHGSILLGKAHEQLAFVSSNPNEESRNKLHEYICSHSVSLSEVCGREISYQECSGAILEAVYNYFD
ncbi:MAG: lipoyl(octanoyl) transferase [Bacteroidota bacterium]|nr:lipoyl(octanoyl) transferase [Bacteroidota bacterium]